MKMGTSEDVCLLHRHINVTVDEKGFPTVLMAKFQRRQNRNLTDNDDRTLELFEWVIRTELAQELQQKESSDYKLFKTRTVGGGGGEGWKIENEDGDSGYEDESYCELEARDVDCMDWTPTGGEEATGLDPEFEECIVRKWNPYREGGHFISVRNFGYASGTCNNRFINPPQNCRRSVRNSRHWQPRQVARPYAYGQMFRRK